MEFDENELLPMKTVARVLTELLPRRVTLNMLNGYVNRGRLATYPPIEPHGPMLLRIGEARDVVMAARVGRPPVDKNCAECGAPIRVNASAVTENNFCDSTCYFEANRKRAAEYKARSNPTNRKSGNRRRAEAASFSAPDRRRGGRPAKDPLVDKTCGKCGVAIRVYADLVREFNYCGKTCFHSHRAERAGLPEVANCETCGVQVARHRRFCSRKCYFVTRRTGETLVKLTCIECGEDFLRTLQRVKGAARTTDRGYCGTTCRNRALTKIPRRSSGKPLGAKKVLKSGYVWIKTEDGWKNEHRVVMARLIERPLLPAETVHHKNGNRADNRPSNLELWNTSQPSGQRAEDKLTWALELLQQYGPDGASRNHGAA